MGERSADLMVANILSDQNTVAELKSDPSGVLQRQAVIAKQASPLETDRMIYRIVVGCLGSVILVVAIGLIYLSTDSRWKIPDGLVAIGSAAVGALAGLLAPTPTGRP